jgi:hypothetical protein
MKYDPTIKPQPQSEEFTYTTEELNEMTVWDVTLMDGLENEPLYYLEDELDNICGDLILF